MNHDKLPFQAKCWPEESVWLDYLNPKTREYWSSLYALENYKGTTRNTYVWNDMNEPSVFGTFENTCEKTMLHFDGERFREHREMHNLYSLLEISSTFKGLQKRDSERRPFLLTRSFFAGAHRYAAMWTGDARTSWEHLKLNLGVLQNLSICGYSFCGADIPGFFGDATDELLVRAYQSGVFYPFMRGHAEKSTKKREPWLLPPETCQKISDAIRLRYVLLPYLYTTFYENTHLKGWPVITPLWAAFKHPKEKVVKEIHDQFMFGQAFLVKPICEPNIKTTEVYLPMNEVWYDYFTQEKVNGGQRKLCPAGDLNKFPLFVKGGSIIPTQNYKYKPSVAHMKDASITLTVAANQEGGANGTLYCDDGESLDYTKGEFSSVQYQYKNLKLEAKVVNDGYKTEAGAYDKIELWGVEQKPKGVNLAVKNKKKNAKIEYDADRKVLKVHLGKKELNLLDEFTLTINY